MKTMRVAMLTYSLRPRGGVVHALCLAEALMKKGVDVRLFSLRRSDIGNESTSFFRPTAVPSTIFDFEWHEEIRKRLKSMVDAIITRLPRNYDIYHTQDCVCDTALHQLAAEENGLPLHVRTVHHIEGFPDPYLNQCEIDALRRNSVKITVSMYWRDQLRQRYDIDSVVIYNGIDLSRFENLPKHRREPFLLFVGGMEARKGLEFAIQTLEILTRRGRELQLLAVAKPGFRGVESHAWFEHLIERCGVSGKVRIIENVSDEQLIDLYSRASVFLLPTRMEGWGLAIMEAMAAGCPVVSTRAGGVPELVTDGENGLLTDVGDLSGFADAVEHLMDDGELKEKICAAACETIGKYSWESTAEKTLQLYEKYISRRGKTIAATP